ncbi:helix-turn-helix transcriptional regulator [Nocardia sp. CDC160]|uniref:helix-turn-helix transcriptional regulator n=1 Tax=Nocardia sp. CDC160 TaxID=3112166 RepID=UPI002DB5CD15|nr:helix-turn-helix transcriptional regulator [Nocardia sp. CDC160]MEC3919299.1 helix-turn-helix transcriptional regulator [Nocardia sp. CDC160]
MSGAAKRDPGNDEDRQLAAVANSLAREIRRLRKAANLSQRQLATRIGYSRQYVSMTEWEDSNLPSLELISAIDDALGTGGALVAMRAKAKRDQQIGRKQPQPASAPSSALGGDSVLLPVIVNGLVVHVPLDPRVLAEAATEPFWPVGESDEDTVIGRRSFIAQGFAAATASAFKPNGALRSDPVDSLIQSRRITDQTITGFTDVTRLLASQRQSIAPDALVSVLSAHRDTVATLFRAAQDDRVKRRLGLVLGETSIVESRLWSALGDRPMALANCAFARKLADELEDPFLGGMARIFESNLRSDAATLIGSDGDIVIGLRMLSEAAAFGDVLPPSARARIAAEQAQAYAVLELPRECQDALNRADRAVNEIGDADRTGLFSDWSTARLRVYEGTCWVFLNEPRKAITALEEALKATGEPDRNVALAAQVDLASAHVLNGELEEGCRIIGETFERLAGMGNQRGIERARRAMERLAPWKTERPVRELEERVDSLSV